jgi:peptidoglycan/xylan/chitin deacetylase (PgdA/CDA1 family)
MPADDRKDPLRRLVAWAIRVALRISARKVGVVLVYHAVDERHGDRRRELVPPHGLALFEAQLRHVRRCYDVVPAAAIPEAVASRRRGRRIPLAITFDDDLESHVRLAAPALRRAGLPATFFITGAGLEGSAEHWWERLQRVADRGLTADERARLVALLGGEPPPRPGRDATIAFGRAIEQLSPQRRDAVDRLLEELAGPPPAGAGLRAAQARALAGDGLELGFHTRRHYRLTTLAGEAIETAMVEGRDAVAAVAGRPPALLAYPHGRADARVARAAQAAGYTAAFTTIPHAVRPDEPRWLLPRVEPSFGGRGRFALQLAQTLSARAAAAADRAAAAAPAAPAAAGPPGSPPAPR